MTTLFAITDRSVSIAERNILQGQQVSAREIRLVDLKQVRQLGAQLLVVGHRARWQGHAELLRVATRGIGICGPILTESEPFDDALQLPGAVGVIAAVSPAQQSRNDANDAGQFAAPKISLEDFEHEELQRSRRHPGSDLIGVNFT